MKGNERTILTPGSMIKPVNDLYLILPLLVKFEQITWHFGINDFSGKQFSKSTLNPLQ